MTGADASAYRINAKLNRVEYADLVGELEAAPETQRRYLIRYWLRLGFATAKGRVDPSSLPLATTGARATPSPAADAPPPTQPTDALDALGLDFAGFRFGDSK